MVYKGRRKVFLSKFLSQGTSKKAMVSNPTVKKKVTNFEVHNFRVIMFDSTSMEKEKKQSTLFTNFKSNKQSYSRFPTADENDFMHDENIDGVIKEEVDDELDKDSNDFENPINAEFNRHFKEKFASKLTSPDHV